MAGRPVAVDERSSSIGQQMAAQTNAELGAERPSAQGRRQGRGTQKANNEPARQWTTYRPQAAGSNAARHGSSAMSECSRVDVKSRQGNQRTGEAH